MLLLSFYTPWKHQANLSVIFLNGFNWEYDELARRAYVDK